MENPNSTRPARENEGPSSRTSPPPPYSGPTSSIESGHARGVVATMGKVDCKDVCVEVHGVRVTAAEVVEEAARMSFKDGVLVAIAKESGTIRPEGEASYLLREQGHARGILVRKGTLKMEGTKVYAEGRSVTTADALNENAEMTLEGIEIKGFAVVDVSLNARFENEGALKQGRGSN
ncbi:hypothetical protein CPB86DRAFT_799869 [Serendipita vermifera]|nr:hypothetical protein CPB86DRAFT_799869 [Serendipita vermifera]